MSDSINNNLDTKVDNSSIGKATVWSFAAEISAKLIVPITNMILAHILAPEAFGIIATINVIVAFADTVSTAGFNKYIVQHNYSTKDEMFKSAYVAFWTNFLISLSGWIIISVFSRQFSAFVGCSGYEPALIVSALSLPLTSFSSIQEAIFQRKLNYKVLFYRRIVVCFLPFVITIPLALLGFGYWSLIIGTLSGNVAKAVLLTATSEWKPKFFYRFSLFKEMFSFSVWTLAESIALWASSYIDIFIISNKLGKHYTGLYKNSQSTVTGILTIITGATTSVLFASLSRFQNDKEGFERIFFTFQKKVAMFVLPLGVGIFFFSDLITQILLGKKWMEASRFIGIWGLCTSLVCVFGTFSREAYRAKGKPKISLLAQVLHLALVIPVCIYGVNKGFNTLIYVRSFAFLLIILIHFIFMKFVIKISPLKMILSVKEPIAASILMGAFAYLLLKFLPHGFILQFVYIVFCIIFYFGFLLLFKEYRNELLAVLKNIKSKLKRG